MIAALAEMLDPSSVQGKPSILTGGGLIDLFRERRRRQLMGTAQNAPSNNRPSLTQRSPFQTMRGNISPIFAAGSFSMRSIHQRSKDSRFGPRRACAGAANSGFESLSKASGFDEALPMPRGKVVLACDLAKSARRPASRRIGVESFLAVRDDRTSPRWELREAIFPC